MKTNNSLSDELHAMLADFLGSQDVWLERIGGGKNSQVYHIQSKFPDGEKHFVVKRYFSHPSDPRDRLGAEFSSLKFIWDHGIRCIPQPILISRENGCAIYEHIKGEILTAADIGEPEIDQAVHFLEALQEMKSKSGSYDLPPASEACFSLQAILDNIDQRMSRLRASGSETPIHTEMLSFLDESLSPTLDKVYKDCRDGLARLGKTLNTELPQLQRILSPSDFGFHNALRRDDGQLVFLDFEYFGWDDPAKTISDFLLHPNPAMELPAFLKERFVREFIACIGTDDYLIERFKLVHPLFSIKWSLIFLNEFLIADYQRRSFATEKVQNRTNILSKQLELAIYYHDKIINPKINEKGKIKWADYSI